MPKVRPEMLREVEQAFQRYADEVQGSGIHVASQANYISHARRFVRWLNDDFEPGARIRRPRRQIPTQ